MLTSRRPLYLIVCRNQADCSFALHPRSVQGQWRPQGEPHELYTCCCLGRLSVMEGSYVRVVECPVSPSRARVRRVASDNGPFGTREKASNRDFHFGRPGLAPSTPKTFCLDRFAVAAHWACPLNRQRAVRESLAEQTAVVLGRFFDTSPTLRPVVAHGLVTPSAVNRPVRAAPRFAGASPQTAAASDGSPPAGASRNERVSPAAHPS